MLLNAPQKAASRIVQSAKSPKLHMNSIIEDAVVYEKVFKFKLQLDKSIKLIAAEEDDITFEQRLFALRDVLTNCDGVHKIWLDLGARKAGAKSDEKAVLLVVKQTLEYEANAIPIEALKEAFCCKGDKFYILNIFGDDSACRPNLQLRISEDGLVGEINWIESSSTVKGCDLFELFDFISDFLKIENIILRDEAKDHQKLPLRVMRPLVKADGQTWYQAKGFEVYDCDSVKVLGEDRTFNQSRVAFRQAVSILKQFKIRDIFSLFFNNRAKERCQKIIKQFPVIEEKENSESIELGELLSRVFAKSVSGKRGSKTAQNDLLFLYTNLLNPKWQSGKVPKFEEACATLHNTGLFIKKR